jgi:hypothetical protein
VDEVVGEASVVLVCGRSAHDLSVAPDADATNIVLPDQLDFFNLVNGQGRTNKNRLTRAFALPTRID